jgi:hypothetical protein
MWLVLTSWQATASMTGAAPGRAMFGASAASRSVTFSSLTASFSSLDASHC